MSKFLKVMIVLLTIVAMAAPVAFAADNLGLSGQMRVRAFHIDKGGDGPTDTKFDQRLRIGGKFSVADGVSVHFRTDFGEQDWGTDGGYGRTDWQLDRAYLQLDGAMGTLQAGQIYVGAGKGIAVDTNDTGMAFTTKTAVPVKVFYALTAGNDTSAVKATSTLTTPYVDIDNDPITLEVKSAVERSDAHLYGVQVAAPSNDDYAAKLFYAGYRDGAAEDVSVIGLSFDYNLDAVKLTGEADFFTGDASSTVDAMGTQFFVDASMAASEAMTVGGAFYYAAGADAGETQYTFVGDHAWNDWDPLNPGAFSVDDFASRNRGYDATGANAGVMAFQLYGKFKASDAAAFTGSIAYAEPEEDANTAVDSTLFLNAGMTYQLMANTSVAAHLSYADADAPGVDASTSAGFGLYVNF